jgi:hypothetical protein
MDTPLVSALNSKCYSWSPQGKDRDGDGNVTREEFKLPVMEGFGAIVPADLRAGGSMDDAFDAYDLNRDGKIDQREIASSPAPKQHAADRFRNNWAEGLTTQQALSYFNVVNADNERLLEQRGFKG